MRLVNARTLQLEEYYGAKIPKYAILSHTWGDEEITFKQWRTPDAWKGKAGYKKIEGGCRQALLDHLDYLWIDTICIDKRHSSELTEAINSMFHWYWNSSVCYVYLADIPSPPGHILQQLRASVAELDRRLRLGDGLDTEEEVFKVSSLILHPFFDSGPLYSLPGIVEATGFQESRWFKRGWTLQELIAPRDVVFFFADWTTIARKQHLNQILSKVTGIDKVVLLTRKEIWNRSVAQRMSWASGRVTTRVEDVAYCLLGIFGINMPMLYGEGPKAFLRLQEEIIKVSNDQSIFAWSIPRLQADDTEKMEEEDIFGRMEFTSILALSPAAFADAGSIVQIHGKERRHYSLTNAGLQITCPFLKTCDPDVVFVALECHDTSESEAQGPGTHQHCLWIPLRRSRNDDWVRETLPFPISLWCFDEHRMTSYGTKNLYIARERPKTLGDSVWISNPHSSQLITWVAPDEFQVRAFRYPVERWPAQAWPWALLTLDSPTAEVHGTVLWIKSRADQEQSFCIFMAKGTDTGDADFWCVCKAIKHEESGHAGHQNDTGFKQFCDDTAGSRLPRIPLPRNKHVQLDSWARHLVDVSVQKDVEDDQGRPISIVQLRIRPRTSRGLTC
jgi:hypothetical protein